MSNTYKFKRVEIRRVIEETCHDVIRDKKIADELYMKIMTPLEDFLSDCEEGADDET
jgi:hypothetical protein